MGMDYSYQYFVEVCNQSDTPILVSSFVGPVQYPRSNLNAIGELNVYLAAGSSRVFGVPDWNWKGYGGPRLVGKHIQKLMTTLHIETEDGASSASVDALPDSSVAVTLDRRVVDGLVVAVAVTLEVEQDMQYWITGSKDIWNENTLPPNPHSHPPTAANCERAVHLVVKQHPWLDEPNSNFTFDLTAPLELTGSRTKADDAPSLLKAVGYYGLSVSIGSQLRVPIPADWAYADQRALWDRPVLRTFMMGTTDEGSVLCTYLNARPHLTEMILSVLRVALLNVAEEEGEVNVVMQNVHGQKTVPLKVRCGDTIEVQHLADTTDVLVEVKNRDGRARVIRPELSVIDDANESQRLLIVPDGHSDLVFYR